MTRIAVLTGGSTPERNVALAGAGLVAAALRRRGHQVAVVDTAFGVINRRRESEFLDPRLALRLPSADELHSIRAREDLLELVGAPDIRDAEVVFLVLHGRQGEGGEVQTLLDLVGASYVGCDAIGSLIAMDKELSKRLFVEAGIPTPPWLVWPASEARVSELGLPLVVKPSRVGSTVGLTVVHERGGIAEAVALASTFDDEVLLEGFVAGREFTVGVLGLEALAVGEIRPQHEIFDYECKYTPGMCQEIFPAEIPEELAAHLREMALRVHRALKLRDFSRVDFRVDDAGQIFCLEANTLPGMTETSLLPQSAAAAGIGYEELCDRIQALALRRRGAPAVA